MKPSRRIGSAVDHDVQRAVARQRQVDGGLRRSGRGDVRGERDGADLLRSLLGHRRGPRPRRRSIRRHRRSPRFAPWRASSSAIARPMPRAPPVTSATLPSRLKDALMPQRPSCAGRRRAVERVGVHVAQRPRLSRAASRSPHPPSPAARPGTPESPRDCRNRRAQHRSPCPSRRPLSALLCSDSTTWTCRFGIPRLPFAQLSLAVHVALVAHAEVDMDRPRHTGRQRRAHDGADRRQARSRRRWPGSGPVCCARR